MVFAIRCIEIFQKNNLFLGNSYFLEHISFKNQLFPKKKAGFRNPGFPKNIVFLRKSRFFHGKPTFS